MNAVIAAADETRPAHPALGRRLAGKAVGNAGLNAATLGFNFLVAVLLSRFLAAGGFGAYAFATAWATLLAVPALMGLPPLVVREIAGSRVLDAPGRIRGVIRRTNQAVLAASLVVCSAALAVFLLSGWPHAPFRSPALLGIALVPLIGIVSLRQSAMQGFGRVVLGRTPEALAAPLILVLSVVVLHLVLGHRFTTTVAMGAAVGSFAAATVGGAVMLRRATPREVRVATPVYATRTWALATVPLMLMSAVSTLNDQLGTVLLGALGDAKAVGEFSVGSRIAALIPFLLLAAVPTLMPSIAELHARGEHDRLQRLMTRAARIVFYGSIPVIVGVVVLAEPMLRVFGSSFASAATPLRILAVGQLVNIATGFPGTILLMIGETGSVTRSVVAGAVANLVLNVTLVPGFGATGTAIAGATSIALTNILLAVLLWRRNRVWSPAIAVR